MQIGECVGSDWTRLRPEDTFRTGFGLPKCMMHGEDIESMEIAVELWCEDHGIDIAKLPVVETYGELLVAAGELMREKQLEQAALVEAGVS